MLLWRVAARRGDADDGEDEDGKNDDGEDDNKDEPRICKVWGLKR